jgi:predicted metal-binding protein
MMDGVEQTPTKTHRDEILDNTREPIMSDIYQTLAGTVFEHVLRRPASMLTISQEVRRICEKNACGVFGRNWTCPPAVLSLEGFREEIDAYDTLLILYQVYQIEDSLDWEGMMSALEDFQGKLRMLKKKVEDATPNQPFLILGAGGCKLCEPCAYETGEACRHPNEAIVSMEARGIDVIRLMKDSGAEYNNGRNRITYIGGLLYRA